ncbi:LLM class flavin-dependent oxidoreductase [Streptomyces sp. NPDC049916]|uniref:LLM class flavin-dependent oxidoreductase n=1 Tax=Streptomyces sp. NPDC049916 TaxID=3155156 RepID=UPI00342FE579
MLFEEKIGLLHQLLDEKPVSWFGPTRAPLRSADVYPKTDSGRLSTWVGVGGIPKSVPRTAQYGFRLILAIIGGAPDRFTPCVDLYRKASRQFGMTAQPVGLHSPGFVAATDEEARELSHPGYKSTRDRIGMQRGWPALCGEEFKAEVGRDRCTSARSKRWRPRSLTRSGCSTRAGSA